MADLLTQSASLLAPAEFDDSLPGVDLEVSHAGRKTMVSLSHVDFLIGTVPGCDLRVPGADLPPVLCLLARHRGGLSLRKLAPTQVILVNGQTAARADLGNGDRVTLGSMDLFVRLKKVTAAAAPVVQTPTPARKTAPALAVDVEPARKVSTVVADTADLDKQRQELAAMRQELADIRRQLYDRYQERRDRLAGLQEAVNRAARKVQDRKRELEAEEQQARQRRQDEGTRRAELDARAKALEEQKGRLDEERRLLEESQGAVQADLEKKLVDLQTREEKLAAERRDLEARLRQYQADLVRLDRLQGSLDERGKKLEEQAREFEAKLARLQSDSADLEEQVVELDQVRANLEQETEQLAGQKKQHDSLSADLAQRSAAVEGQQATLAALRTRLERTREEVRAQEQHIDQERARQQAVQAELDRDRRGLAQLRTQLENEQQLREQERAQLVERGATLEAAVSQLQEAQDKLAEREKSLEQQTTDLERRDALVLEKEGILDGRLKQLSEAQERLDLERRALRERTQALTETELAREALQEQLRRRSEELAARQNAVNEKMQECEAQAAGIEARKAEALRQVQEAQAQFETWRQQQAAEAQALEARQEEQSRREAHHQEQYQHLQSLGRDIAAERKALADLRTNTRQEQEAWLEKQQRGQEEFETLRQETTALAQQLPDVELRAGTALERLTHAREQLRDHLSELHAYVQECRDDLENSRGRLQQEEARLEEQQQALRRGQEEQRLAMVAFRQQMIGWQGQIVDLRRLLAKDETRLERRQAQVEEQAKEVGAASEKLAQKADELQQERHLVAGKRQEMDRHLVDMREWYRRKLRELAGIEDTTAALDGEQAPADVVPMPLAQDGALSIPEAEHPENEDTFIPTGRDILSLTEPVDAGDRKLSELLTSLELIDKDSLSALLVEARRQRRSLRQVLLASGVVTLYQLALIEAGNVAGLMLGPVRVIDRLRATAHEAVYRVFDPRRGCEAVLRHLAEEEMLDAVHPDEFRQHFTQARLASPHVAAILEVLDIAGRPAVLQEWLSGLPSSDWPPLAAAPGVCFRLFTQAALALDTIHKAGLVHGSLGEGSIFLTSEGILKISGVGEPAWLRGGEETTEPRADLRALGKIVSGWCTPSGVRKGPKTKPLPDALAKILVRLASDGTNGYASAADLLDDLDRAGGEVPSNAEAWERLLRHVREHAAPETAARRSA